MSGTTSGGDIVIGSGAGDTVSGQQGNDVLIGFGGADSINGAKDNDTVLGGDGDDFVKGGIGNDFVDGGAGNDLVRGNSGNDTLMGGLGTDTLNGGTGADVYRFDSAAEGGDQVSYEVPDSIQISASGFGGGLVEGQALVFGETFFTVNSDGAMPTGLGAAGAFIQDLDTRTLWWDVDGAGATEAVLIGTFSGVSIVAEDFIIAA